MGIFGKGLKGFSFLQKAEKVEHKVPRTPELGALNDAVPGKVPYLKMFEASKYEIDMIGDSSRNLKAILKDFDPKDRFIVESLNKKANLWIEARLGNINNMLDYTIAHPGNLKEFNEMVINGVSSIGKQVNFNAGKGFLITEGNVIQIKDIKEKILLLKKK